MEETRLDNGLTLLLCPFPGKTTGIDFSANFGSAFERGKEAGIAHFLEHVFFSGSKKLGRRKPFELVEGSGGELNAYTSKEETHFYARVQNAEFSVPLVVLGECYRDGFFPKALVETERKIILNEIRESFDNPVKRLFGEFTEICLSPPYNRRTIGKKETVKSISAAGLEKCLKENYFSGNCVLGIATSLKENEVIEAVEERFPTRKGRAKKAPIAAAKPKEAERESIAKTEQAHCCLGFPVMNARHRDCLCFELIATHLGGGLSSRLVQEIREKRGLSYAVSAFMDAESEHGMFAVYFSTKPEKIAKAKALVLKEFRSLQERELAGGILARVKKQLIGMKRLELENSFNAARSLVDYWRYGHKSLDEIIGKIKGIRPAGVKRVSREFLQPEEYAFAKLLPAKGKR